MGSRYHTIQYNIWNAFWTSCDQLHLPVYYPNLRNFNLGQPRVKSIDQSCSLFDAMAGEFQQQHAFVCFIKLRWNSRMSQYQPENLPVVTIVATLVGHCMVSPMISISLNHLSWSCIQKKWFSWSGSNDAASLWYTTEPDITHMMFFLNSTSSNDSKPKHARNIHPQV